MIEKFEQFNEEKGDKWIKDAVKKPGSLRKSMRKKKGEKITKGEIDSELQALRGKDKDKKKPGVQLGKRDATKYKRLNLAKTLKSLKENNGTQNYMFFNNLNTIKRLVDEMLDMDESMIDSLLSEHDWASDHISVANENIEHVFNFLSSMNGNEESEDKLMGGPESSHTEHDDKMRDLEDIKKFDNFE